MAISKTHLVYFPSVGVEKASLKLHILPVVWDTLLVAQFVEALRYKPEGRGFDSRWCNSNFLLT
jgi:hypothetical protein